MSYTEFYVDNATGNNLNAGSGTAAAAIALTSRDWDGTSVFTAQDGDDLSGVFVGDFASVYADGATETGYVARVTAVDDTAPGKSITLSTTARAGTAPTTGTGNRSIRIGGAWAGPSGSSGFPVGFATTDLRNTSGHPPRINIKSGTAYSVSSTISRAITGPITFQGYATTAGDGGRAEIKNANSTPLKVLDLAAGSDGTAVVGLIFDGNSPASGTAVNLVAAASTEVIFERCTFRNCRGDGLYWAVSSGVISECESHGNTRYGYYSNSPLAFIHLFTRCIAHDNTSHGFYLNAGAACFNCIADRNGGDGFNYYSSHFVVLSHCDAFANTGDGFGMEHSALAAAFVENCNFVSNGAYGISVANQPVLMRIINCGHYGNTSGFLGGTTTLVQEIGTISLGANPYVDAEATGNPRGGNFAIMLPAAKGASRSSYLQTATNYDSTISVTMDLGAADHADSPGGSILISGLGSHLIKGGESNMLQYQPGDSWSLQFTTCSTTGASANADSTPTVTVYRNGVDDSVNWALHDVTNPATGRYRVTGTVNANASEGELIEVHVAATISTIAATAVVERFQVGVLDANVVQVDGQSATPENGILDVNVVRVDGVTITGSVPATVVDKAGFSLAVDQSAVTVGTVSTLTDKAGFSLAADQSAVTVGTVSTLTDKAGFSLAADQSAVTVGTVSTLTDKAGFSLASNGLDAISVADPGNVANMNTLPKILVALWRRFYKKSVLTNAQLATYADDGATINTAQVCSYDGTAQSLEAAL